MKLKVHYESNLIMIQQLDEEDVIKSKLYNFSLYIYIYANFQILWHVFYVTNIFLKMKIIQDVIFYIIKNIIAKRLCMWLQFERGAGHVVCFHPKTLAHCSHML